MKALVQAAILAAFTTISVGCGGGEVKDTSPKLANPNAPQLKRAGMNATGGGEAAKPAAGPKTNTSEN